MSKVQQEDWFLTTYQSCLKSQIDIMYLETMTLLYQDSEQL